MAATRRIGVRFTEADKTRALDFDRADRTVTYDGTAKVIRLRN
jgi:hypothetical protein